MTTYSMELFYIEMSPFLKEVFENKILKFYAQNLNDFFCTLKGFKFEEEFWKSDTIFDVEFF